MTAFELITALMYRLMYRHCSAAVAAAAVLASEAAAYWSIAGRAPDVIGYARFDVIFSDHCVISLFERTFAVTNTTAACKHGKTRDTLTFL